MTKSAYRPSSLVSAILLLGSLFGAAAAREPLQNPTDAETAQARAKGGCADPWVSMVVNKYLHRWPSSPEAPECDKQHYASGTWNSYDQLDSAADAFWAVTNYYGLFEGHARVAGTNQQVYYYKPSQTWFVVDPAAVGVATTRLVASGGGNLVASGGGNLVASGGGNLVASGGGNFTNAIAVGGQSMKILLNGGGN
jgi:hypothetical protein